MRKRSPRFTKSKPTAIRAGMDLFKRAELTRDVRRFALEIGIGNIKHPTQAELIQASQDIHSIFGGVFPYEATVGDDDVRKAAFTLLELNGCPTEGWYWQSTDGGTGAMEQLAKMINIGKSMVGFAPMYPNYYNVLSDFGVRMVTIEANRNEDGTYNLPDPDTIRKRIREEDADAVLVITPNNPVGYTLPQDALDTVAQICVEEDRYYVEDMAYLGFDHKGNSTPSIMHSHVNVPGIQGMRVVVFSFSKAMHLCGARAGGFMTDNEEIHIESTNNASAYLGPNTFGQKLVGTLARVEPGSIAAFRAEQNARYGRVMNTVVDGTRSKALEVGYELDVSEPVGPPYSLVELGKIDAFRSGVATPMKLMKYMAENVSVTIDGKAYTVIPAPGEAFGAPTAVRIAHVLPEKLMHLVPEVFVGGLHQYMQKEVRSRVANL